MTATANTETATSLQLDIILQLWLSKFTNARGFNSGANEGQRLATPVLHVLLWNAADLTVLVPENYHFATRHLLMTTSQGLLTC